MKPEWRRFAPLGLYLALLAALVAAGLYIVQREWNLPLQICLALIIIGVAAYGILDPNGVRVALTGRQARYGSNALVMSLAFLGILVVVNYLGYTYTKSWDLTEDKSNTLAKETLDTLQSLPGKVTATAFFSQQVNPDNAKSLLEQYAKNSKGNFGYKFVNPDGDPVAAKAANLAAGQDGVVVLAMGDRQEQVKLVDEQEMTSALVRLMSNEKRSIYFLIGHGEASPDDSGNQSYSKLKSTLQGKNYTVQTLNLLATHTIPDDAKVIVIGGPRKQISQQEMDLLKGYQEKGGALVVMEEPLPLTDFGTAPDPMADYLASSWGIVLGKDLVVDLSSQEPSWAVGIPNSGHSITQKLSTMVTILPSARSVTVKKANLPQGVTDSELLATAEKSWAETDLSAFAQGSQTKVAPDPAVDMIGPVPIAQAGENSSTKARVVVFGDSEFVLDVYFGAYGNGDLFVNAIDWSAGQENLLNLTPKATKQRMLVPPKSTTLGLLLLGSVIGLPGLVVVAGIISWIVRRRHG